MSTKFENILTEKDDELTPARLAQATKRAGTKFDSAICDLEEQIQDTNEEIIDLEKAFVKGADKEVIKQIAEKQIELEEIEAVLTKVVAKRKELLVTDAPTPKS